MNNNQLIGESRCLQYVRWPRNKQFKSPKCVQFYNSEFENDNIITCYRNMHILYQTHFQRTVFVYQNGKLFEKISR